jgi:hypothetical protein
LGYFIENPANIIFTKNQIYIDGIIHFSDYQNPLVYSNLFQNLNVFESNLRSYIQDHGVTKHTYIEYLEQYELKRAKKEEYKIKIKKQIDNLKNDSTSSFENTYFMDLMNFCVSKFHSKETLDTLGLAFLKDKSNNFKDPYSRIINDLRNFVMHHHLISGETSVNIHDFSSFKSFFEKVMCFKEAFNKLAHHRNSQLRSKIEIPIYLNSYQVLTIHQ